MELLGQWKAKTLEPIVVLDREDRKMFVSRDTLNAIEHVLPPTPARHTVYTLDDFVTSAERWASKSSVVFHNEQGAVLVLDDHNRRESVTMPLSTTAVWEKVLALREQVFDQRGFLRLLRYDLASIVPGSLVTAIQKIEVVTSSQQRSEINPGRERGTREFAADLASSGEIPERVTCSLPVYLLPGLDQQVPITFALEYTLPPGPVSFIFRPLPDEVERTLQQLQGELHRMLVDALDNRDDKLTIPVLYGVAG
jgi:hypothetical protein